MLFRALYSRANSLATKTKTLTCRMSSAGSTTSRRSLGTVRNFSSYSTALQSAAPTDANVLIIGETGSGKELIARAIHSRSARRNSPLVKVNCGAIPSGLVESELFGHVKGAFTSASDRRIGRFELANNGTLFLDEVGELPLETQVKLLRVLQEQEFEPVGSNRTIKVNVRIIAATNRDLEKAVQSGEFRSDLYYRLNVIPLRVPALRERRSDIPEMVMAFLQQSAKRMGKPVQSVSRETMRLLVDYSWPGNIRELQNVIERGVVLSKGSILKLGADLLPIEESDTSIEPESIAEIESQRFARRHTTPAYSASAREDRLGDQRTQRRRSHPGSSPEHPSQFDEQTGNSACASARQGCMRRLIVHWEQRETQPPGRCHSLLVTIAHLSSTNSSPVKCWLR